MLTEASPTVLLWCVRRFVAEGVHYRLGEGGVAVQRITRDRACQYLFDARTPPVLRVEPGERFVVETEDASSGMLRQSEDWDAYNSSHLKRTVPSLGNPMGGPVYVEGAEKGDLLAVHIHEIVPAKVGHTWIPPQGGPLWDSRRWAEAAAPSVHRIEHRPGPSGTTRDGTGVLNERVQWPLAPFIGTIGVAPEVEVETSSVGQGPWGGNLDCRDIKEDSTVLLNCSHAGGLLHVGDVHASQGDTEFYGAADETRAEVTLSCEVIKAKRIPFLRIEKPESIVSVCCYRPLEDAVEAAIVHLMEWMVEEYDISQKEAYIHTTCNPDFRVNIYQMVRIGKIQYTVGAEILKRYL